MGQHGPVPNRTDQRRRANKPEIEVDSAPGATDVEIPEPADHWLPMCRRWYESLAESGQSRWYEPSDWAQAYLLTEMLDREMQKAKGANGMVISAWMHGAAELMTTEGARRRMRIELAKGNQGDPDKDNAVDDLAAFRKRMTG